MKFIVATPYTHGLDDFDKLESKVPESTQVSPSLANCFLSRRF